jgi:hypothetical protein
MYLTIGFENNMITIMRRVAVIWAMFISFSYLLLNIAWEKEEAIGRVIVPEGLDLSFHYWEMSVGMSMMFVFVLMYLSIKKGFYGNKRTD